MKVMHRAEILIQHMGGSPHPPFRIHKIKVIDAKKKTDYKTFFFGFLLSSFSQSFFLPLAENLRQTN